MKDPMQLPTSPAVLPNQTLFDLDLAQVSKAGLGSSGYADTTGSRLMKGQDPVNYMYGDIANNAAQAADRGVNQLLAITRMEQAPTETKIMEMEREGSVRYHHITKDMQAHGIQGLPVQGSNPTDVQQAFQISEAPVYAMNREMPNPEKVAVVASERHGGLSPAALQALGQVERNRGIINSLPIDADPIRQQVNTSSGLPFDPQMYESATVPKELIALAMQKEASQAAAAPKPAAVTHPATSGYTDSTGTKVMTGSFGGPVDATSLASANPSVADAVVGSGEGVVNYADGEPIAPVTTMGEGAPAPEPPKGHTSGKWGLMGLIGVMAVGGFYLMTR